MAKDTMEQAAEIAFLAQEIVTHCQQKGKDPLMLSAALKCASEAFQQSVSMQATVQALGKAMRKV